MRSLNYPQIQLILPYQVRVSLDIPLLSLVQPSQNTSRRRTVFMRDENFWQKVKLGQIFGQERESQSLCFDFSDSHLKTCFLQKATAVSKRYGGLSISPRKQKQQIQKLSALTIGFLKNIYIVIDVERGPFKF